METLVTSIIDITYSNSCSSTDPPSGAITGKSWCAVSNSIRQWGYCLPTSGNEDCSGDLWINDGLEGKNCYSILNLAKGALPWQEAEANCNSIGGHILSLESPQEYTAVKSLVNRMVGQSNYRSYMWLGLNDRRQEGIWEWSDDSPLSFVNWLDLQPYTFNGREEDCVAFAGYNWRWADTSCERADIRFICKKPNPDFTPDPTTPPTTSLQASPACDKGWKLIGYSCFKITTNIDEWSIVNARCLELNARLAEFNNVHNVTHYYDQIALWLESQSYVIPDQTGVWFALKENTTGTDSKYFSYPMQWNTAARTIVKSHWSYNQPQAARTSDGTTTGKASAKDHCVEIKLETGRWSVANCKSTRPGLCEKNSTSNQVSNDSTLPTPCKPTETEFTDADNITYCYYLSTPTMTYTNAKTMCYAWNSNVATIRNHYELAFIRTKLFKSTSTTAWIATKATFTHDANTTFLSMYEIDEFNQKEYPLSYSNWDHEQPKAVQSDDGKDYCTYLTPPSAFWKIAECNDGYLENFSICKPHGIFDRYFNTNR